MKALVCCLNSKFVHASLAPWCLTAGVQAYCRTPWEADVAETTINGDGTDLLRRVYEEKPAVVSFCTYIWNIEMTLALCRDIKSHTGAAIILGGPEVAYRAKEALEAYPYIDYILSGEGEESFPAFLDGFAAGDITAVDGLSYRVSGQILSIPEKVYTGTPVSPYTPEFFDRLHGRICYIETSRGCPYRCAFCLSGRCSPTRFFDMDRVRHDILALANSGTQTVKFVDRTFNANEQRANEILTFIIDNYGEAIPAGVCFHFEIAGDILTKRTLAILQSAPVGAIQLEIGMQSFNEETLAAINRKTNTKKLIANIEELLSFQNMHIHIDLIAGLTGEDMASFERSFDIGYRLHAHMLQMGFLKLLYGADMREQPEKYPCTFNPAPPYEVTETPWLSRDDIQKLKKCEDALERLYNSGRFLTTLQYLIDECGYTPFRLFMDFGCALDGTHMPLGAYADGVYRYFSPHCDPVILREKLLIDLLSCSLSELPPPSLRDTGLRYKKMKRHFVRLYEGRTYIVLLDSCRQVYAVNEHDPKDLFGRYRGTYYPMPEPEQLA